MLDGIIRRQRVKKIGVSPSDQKKAGGGQQCPSCGERRSSVADSRVIAEGHTRRRRVCHPCGHRWTTLEITVTELGVEELEARMKLRKIQEIIDAK